MAIRTWTLTFMDRQVTGADHYELDVVAEDSTQAVITGVRSFAAMGGDTGRWMPARVVETTDPIGWRLHHDVVA